MIDDNDLRDALGRGADTVPPLDPARLIAGAHRRRMLRGLVTAGVASGAVVAVVAGGLVVAADGPSGSGLPGPPVVGSPATPSAPADPTTNPNPRPSQAPWTPGTSTVTIPYCLGHLADGAQADGRPESSTKSNKESFTKLRLDTTAGTTLIVADGARWFGCDQSRQDKDQQPSLIEPDSLKPPSTQQVDPFRVSTVAVPVGDSLHLRFWAVGRLPAGVRAIRYTFSDGARRDAKVAGGFWAMQYQSPQPYAQKLNLRKLARIKVELVAPGGGILKTFRLDWGADTCAQTNHGC